MSANNRKDFLRGLEFCRKNKIDAFIVLRVSRFARNTEYHFFVRSLLAKYGTTLHSVTEPIGNKPSEKFIETVLAGAADYENAIRRQQCIDGMSQKLKQGIWPWRTPTGYICAHNKKHDQKKTEPEKPQPVVFELLQKLFKEYAKGLITEMKMLAELKKSKFQELTGKKPTRQLVSQLFGPQLTFYAGWLINPWPSEDGSDKLIRGKHKPMITDEELKAIKLLKKGGQAGVTKSRDNPKFPLRAFVRCPTCHHPLTGSSPKGQYQRFDYYHCFQEGCPLRYKSIPKEDMEEAFISMLEEIIPNPAFTAYFEAVVLGHFQSQTAELKKSASVYEKQLAELQAKRKNIFEMRESGVYTTEEFRERMEDVKNQIGVVETAISETSLDDYDLEEGLEHARQSITDISKHWLKLEMPIRKKVPKVNIPWRNLLRQKFTFWNS